MSFSNPYAAHGNPQAVAYAQASERTAFIQRTYLHLALAIFAFVMLEATLLALFPAQTIVNALRPLLGGWGWLLFLGGFMAVSWVARSWAESDNSRATQYAGLGMYVLAEAGLFLPMMALSTLLDPMIPLNAGIITLFVFAGLTGFVFISGTDFSGLGRFLWLGGFAAIGVIVTGLVFGFHLGVWFSGLMVLLASGYILYDTSRVMRHYRTDQHVAASLALFASVALLLWYVMRILMALREQ